MELNIHKIDQSDIDKMKDEFFGEGGKLSHLSELQDIECYCEVTEKDE